MHPDVLIASLRSDAVFAWIFGAISMSLCVAPAILLLIAMVLQVGKPPTQDRLGHGFQVVPKTKPEETSPTIPTLKENEPAATKKE